MKAESGRNIHVTGSKVVGVVSCVPKKEVRNEYFHSKFTEQGVTDVIKMIGVQTRRWVDDNVSAGDLCLAAGKKLLNDLNWDPSTIDALIFISQTPDYRLPSTALTLQREMKISQRCIAFDINLGCSGYPYALWLGMTMIQSGAANRVLLAVGDTVSKIVDPQDRATAMLFGDAGSMTAIESATSEDQAFFILGSDGKGANNLIIPKGGFKDYSKANDARLKDKNSACLYMDGGEIFNFTLKTIPILVNETIEFAGLTLASYDYLLFHQANLFMLKHLAKKIKCPDEKFPININQFGNTSCASIPLLITTDLSKNFTKQGAQVGMFGFGVGYSWASASIDLSNLKVAELIEYESV